MYKNLVFDLGGVVVNYSPQDYLVDRIFHARIEKTIYDAMFGSKEWIMLDEGTLDYDEASRIFLERGQKADIEFEMQAVIDNWPEMLTNRRATVNLMRLLKKRGYQLYYLSNISFATLEMLKKRSFWPMFDGGVASCEEHLLKPDPEIYKRLLAKYELNPQETIFADDNADNAAAAFHAGITGVQFKNVKSFCKMLVTYGIQI